jgi:CheY-like chemotaxis protein
MTAKVKKILLVEDSEHDIELTIAALDGHNLANKVDVAHDGAEALDYLYKRGAFASRANGPPIVVLLDLKMPRVDGLEVLRQMKADPELKSIPVVMLTESVKQLGCFWALINEPPPLSP